MSQHESMGGAMPFDSRSGDNEYDKETIRRQFDKFAGLHKIKTFHDRLRIGFNEVSVLAFERTNRLVRDMVGRLASTPEEAQRVYADLVNICVGMQEGGPWGYAKDLANPESPEMKAWFMLEGAMAIGNTRQMDLNELEFIDDIKRIEKNLAEASRDPAVFFDASRERLIEGSEKTIRFGEGDADKIVPIGEDFSTFLPMAIRGYGSGVVQDAEGWVYVGAREAINSSMLESMGLRKEIGSDDRNPTRNVTYFANESGQRVIKQPFPGLLVVVSRSLELASSVVRAINSDQEVVDVAEDSLGHTRVVQTTEKKREQFGLEDERLPEGFMRRPERPIGDVRSGSTELTRPREEFYRDLLYVRGNYVYVDALRQLKAKRAAEGKDVTDHEKKLLAEKIWKKMEQKVDELRHVNGILDEQLANMPEGIRSVIDMAGGAGDLGLAVSNELLSMGREIDRVEIVDPQEGVAEFMQTIIDYLPFRKRMEEVAVHNTGYLQDARITPDSIVVAKHACGTLTDAVIEQWRDSESAMLVAMTCCQGKAKGESARYGFSQAQWDQLCQESDLTNTTLPDAPGKARERALARLERGNRAMKRIDMARVEYLRRHGFKAELSTTDKFPKGDVIIARRLPKNFMTKLGEAHALEKSDPNAFDAFMMKLDVLAAGGDPKGFDRASYGEGWIADDFAEIARRFVASRFEELVPVNASPDKPSVANAGEANPDAKASQKQVIGNVFDDVKGRIDLYVQTRAKAAGKTVELRGLGSIIDAIRTRVFRHDGESPTDIRAGVDTMMAEMGF